MNSFIVRTKYLGHNAVFTWRTSYTFPNRFLITTTVNYSYYRILIFFRKLKWDKLLTWFPSRSQVLAQLHGSGRNYTLILLDASSWDAGFNKFIAAQAQSQQTTKLWLLPIFPSLTILPPSPLFLLSLPKIFYLNKVFYHYNANLSKLPSSQHCF